MKIVINKCYGGFSLSPEAALECFKRGMKIATPVSEYFTDRDKGVLRHSERLAEWRKYLASKPERHMDGFFVTVFSPDETQVISTRPDDRTDPIMVAVVEEMGEKANGGCADLRVIEIPDGTDWSLDEYDGIESVHETHQSWS